MKQRAGVTLVEVLVAILLTAVGLLALLVLFPVGALNMAQAIKDDRTAHAAANANTIASANIWDVRHDSMLATDPWLQPSATAPYDSFFANPPPNTSNGAFANPYAWVPSPPTTSAAAPVLAAGPSYPVFIDPIGWRVFQGLKPLANGVTTAAGQVIAIPLANFSLIPRVMPRFLTDPAVNSNLGSGVAQNQQITRWMTSLEDLSFSSGLPVADVGVLERDTRYSCAFLARIPQLSAPNSVDLTVLVYNKRALEVDGQGNPVGETYYGSSTGYTVSFPLNGTSSSNVITIQYQSGPPPAIKRGSWIMDATYLYTNNAGNATVSAPPTGYCYRVVKVSDPYSDPSGNGNTDVDVELQTSLRNTYPTGKATATQPAPQPGIILLDDVSEVFEMGGGS